MSIYMFLRKRRKAQDGLIIQSQVQCKDFRLELKQTSAEITQISDVESDQKLKQLFNELTTIGNHSKPYIQDDTVVWYNTVDDMVKHSTL